jgi:hypothetical protein
MIKGTTGRHHVEMCNRLWLPFGASPWLSIDDHDETFLCHQKTRSRPTSPTIFFIASSHTILLNLQTSPRHFRTTQPSTRISFLLFVMTPSNNQSAQSEQSEPSLSSAGSAGGKGHPEQTENGPSFTRSTDSTSLIRPPQTHTYSRWYLGRGGGSGSRIRGTGVSSGPNTQSVKACIPPTQPSDSSSFQRPLPQSAGNRPIDLGPREYQIQTGTRATPGFGLDHDTPRFVRCPSANESATTCPKPPAYSITRDGRSSRGLQGPDLASGKRQRRRSCRGIMGAFGASLAGASQIFVGVNCFGG